MDADPGLDKYWEDRRTDARRLIEGPIEVGQLVHDGAEVDFIPIDVSRTGFGILARKCISRGDVVQLTFATHPDTPLLFRVMWVKPVLHEADSVRYGLKLESEGPDLEALVGALYATLSD